MTFKLSLKIKLNSLINKQIQEVFFMESNSSNFIYTVTPQFWFVRLLSHSFDSRFEKSTCFTKSHSFFTVVWWIVYDLSGYIRWLIVPIFSTIECSLYLMRSLPIFSFFYLSNPWYLYLRFKNLEILNPKPNFHFHPWLSRFTR